MPVFLLERCQIEDVLLPYSGNGRSQNPAEGKSIKFADSFLRKHAILLRFAGFGHPMPQCRVWLVSFRDIAVPVLFLKRSQFFEPPLP
jgi:hypothetical protein